MSRSQIDRGFRRLNTVGSGTVPTLPQFMKACTQSGDDEGTIRPAYQQLPEVIDSRDKWDRYADYLMLNYFLRHYGVPDGSSLPQLLEIKRRVAADYRLIGAEESVKAEEIRDQLHKQWDATWKKPAEKAA